MNKSLPSSKTVPLVGFFIPLIKDINVVFPVPEPPTNATNSPGLIVILISFDIIFFLPLTLTTLVISLASILTPNSCVWKKMLL